MNIKNTKKIGQRKKKSKCKFENKDEDKDEHKEYKKLFSNKKIGKEDWSYFFKKKKTTTKL